MLKNLEFLSHNLAKIFGLFLAIFSAFLVHILWEYLANLCIFFGP